MAKEQVLYSTEWLELRKKHFENLDVDYIYCHAVKTGGHAVAVLPFRRVDGEGMQFLLRREIVPPWDDEEQTICSITGSHDQPQPLDTAVKELHEEGGYVVPGGDFLDLGKCRNSKASDTTYHLFAVNLTGLGRDEAEGDGTPLEELAETFWAGRDVLVSSPDVLLHVMYNRLTA